MHKLIVFKLEPGHFSFSDLDMEVHRFLEKTGKKPWIGHHAGGWGGWYVYYEFDTEEEAALFKLTHL